jgi:hypothetical protein
MKKDRLANEMLQICALFVCYLSTAAYFAVTFEKNNSKTNNK